MVKNSKGGTGCEVPVFFLVTPNSRPENLDELEISFTTSTRKAFCEILMNFYPSKLDPLAFLQVVH